MNHKNFKLFFLFIPLLLLPITQSALSQPAIEFLQQFDTGRNDAFYDVYAVSDGGFIACGAIWTENTEYPYRSSGDRYIVRTDRNGREIWSLRLEGLVRAKSIIETDDGDFLVGGGGDNRFVGFRISEDGELTWTRNYFAGGCNAIIELKNNDFLLAGMSNPGFESTGCIVRIAGNGDVIWSNDYDPGSRGCLYAIRETEAGVIAVGSAGTSPWALKAELDRGELDWSNVYQQEYYYGAYSLISTEDGNFVLGGNGAGGMIIKFDPAGNLLWRRRVNDEELEVVSGLSRIEGTGFVGVGFMNMFVNGRLGLDRFIVMRFDLDGSMLWQQIYALDDDVRYETAFNRLYSVVTVGSSIIAVGGLKNEGGISDWDAVLMRLEPDVLGPQVFYKLPEDSILTFLLDSTVTFVVRCRSRYHEEMEYQWLLDEEPIGDDTTMTKTFDENGNYEVDCRVSNVDATINITWHVTVTDLYVSAFTPDTLDLALRRGSSVDFSLDTIRYTDGNEPEILWTKTNLSNGQSEAAGTEPRAPIDFPWSGEYSVEGRVFRGESSDAVTWHVQVKGAIWAFIPVADSLEVLPDSVVHFEVVPSAPEDESLEVAWSVDGELVREGELALDWAFGEAGGEADSCPPHQVLCIVADSVETDTVGWVVTVNELGIGSDKEVGNPGRVALLSVSPNPFNSTLTIRFTGGLETAATRLGYATGSQAAPTRLGIYDIAGREVARLLGSTGVSAGQGFHPAAEGGATEHQITWDASASSAGVYFVRLQAGSKVSTKKVVLMR